MNEVEFKMAFGVLLCFDLVGSERCEEKVRGGPLDAAMSRTALLSMVASFTSAVLHNPGASSSGVPSSCSLRQELFSARPIVETRWSRNNTIGRGASENE